MLTDREARALKATCEFARIAFERLEISAPVGEDNLGRAEQKLADALHEVEAHELVSSLGNDFELDRWDPRRAAPQAFPGGNQ